MLYLVGKVGRRRVYRVDFLSNNLFVIIKLNKNINDWYYKKTH